MFKKLILLTSIIAIFATACNKEDSPLPDNTVEIESQENSINLRGGGFGPSLGLGCNINHNLGVRISDLWYGDSLNIVTDSVGTGFYNVQIGEMTSFDLRFDSEVYSGNVKVVSAEIIVDNPPQTISIGNDPSVSMDLVLNDSTEVELTILSTDGIFLYERKVDFTAKLEKEEANRVGPSIDEILCLEFIFDNIHSAKACDIDHTGAIIIGIP